MREQKLFTSQLLGESYTYIKHASGLPIYIFPKKMTTAHALFATDFGSVDIYLDQDGKQRLPDGVAHFLEHKLFTNEDGSDSFERFSALGADANAYTSHTRTVYLFSATDRFLDSLAELIDFVTHPFFEEESVEREKGIIGEEIRMCRDNPYDRCYYNMLAGLYRKHPIKTEICGSVRSIAKITPRVLYDTYHTFYHLSNMALVVSGDVTVEEVLAVADAHLPRSATPVEIPRVRVDEDPCVSVARTEAEGQVAKPIFCIGIKEAVLPDDPIERARRDAGLTILSEMLFSPSGDLYRDLFEKGMISPEFSADYALTRGFGFLQICGEADDPDAVYREILQYLDTQREKGLSQQDFERAKRVEFAEYIKGFDSTEEIANTLLAFVFDDTDLFAYADIVEEMEFSYIEHLFEEFFAKDRFTLSIVKPKEGANL